MTAVEEKGSPTMATVDKKSDQHEVLTTTDDDLRWRVMKDVGELWRFTTGKTNEDQCVPGDECIVLRTYHANFIGDDRDAKILQNYHQKVDEKHKFIYKYFGDGIIGLQTLNGYWIEVNGIQMVTQRTRATETAGDIQKFRVWIQDKDYLPDYQDWRMLLQNVSTNHYWYAQRKNRIMTQKGATDYCVFYGYKMGKKEDWVRRDEWSWVASLTNPSGQVNTLKYSETVGTSITESQTVTWRLGANISIGATFGKGFEAKMESSIGYDWSRTNSKTWSSEVTTEVDAQVDAGKKVSIYQVVGYWGNMVSKTPSFKTVEEEAEEFKAIVEDANDQNVPLSLEDEEDHKDLLSL